MAQTSGVLVIGHPRPEKIDFGADAVKDFAAARNHIERHRPSIVVFGGAGDVDEFCNFMLEHSPRSLWILACEGLKPPQIIKWNNGGRVVEMIDGMEDPELEAKLHLAMEAAGEQAQERQHVQMFTEQTAQLKKLTTELESRVQRRHKTLRKSLRTLEETKGRLEAFHKALLGIHRASTTLQMEQTLNEALKNTVNMVWVRVRFEHQSSLRQQVGGNVLGIEIPFLSEKLRGEVLFSKAEGKRFSADEKDFLHELTEALALALSRLQKLDEAETLKGQWQATFDSIPHPLCLANADFEIFKLNRAFQLACGAASFRDLLGKNAFSVFFGSQAPLEVDKASSFRQARTSANGTEHFEVTCEDLGMTLEGQAMRLVLLRPITEEVRFERRIFEGSKLAELGTIGSSIAHELNNPLGGMLSFLQLIRMDLATDHPIMPEIMGMEEATLRCRDIVINLLGFARKQDLGEFSPIDLTDVIDRAVKLIELQSKSSGIKIHRTGAGPAPVLGSLNALSQALCNLLQNSLDAIQDRIKDDPLFPGRIDIDLQTQHGKYILRLTDNGSGVKPEFQSQIFNPLFTTRDPRLYGGMGLTTAFTIISEHSGILEILSQTGSGTTAIISLDALKQA